MADGIGLTYLWFETDDTYSSQDRVVSILEKYDVDSVLIGKDKPLYVYILSNPELFSCIYDNESEALFWVTAIF